MGLLAGSLRKIKLVPAPRAESVRWRTGGSKQGLNRTGYRGGLLA
jgi:hypothetical protein